MVHAHDGQTTDRRPARLSTSTIHPSGTSSSVSDAEPHIEHVAIDVNGTDGDPDRYGALDARASRVGSDHELTLLGSPTMTPPATATETVRPCSIERALQIIGDRWSVLVLRDAFRGIRRFDDFRRDLDIARPVLADRLRRLVDAGVLERRQYCEHPPRFEYCLTPMGVDLSPALVALMRWGDELAERRRRPAHRCSSTARAATSWTRRSCAGRASRPSHPPPSGAGPGRVPTTKENPVRDPYALLTTPLPDLLAEASAIRDAAHGRRVTYSPKVFIPLTMLCRDACGYCTFAQPPARLDQPYLDRDDVLAIARAGRRRWGATRRSSRSASGPSCATTWPASWLADHGYASTVDYLAAMARLVLDETGLLPHANAGALFADELAQLRPVAPSQGMMLESLNPDLACHRGAPDKEPERRLATLEAAGELSIPFTTGILVGIGESRADRIDALEAIAASHARHGHVQEVIVQNFLPKLRTAMQHAAACPPDEMLWTIAAARLLLPPEIHLQAPPNLSDDFGVLLDAGIDDWGGVSPVTADHVNPERPWPALDRLREVTEAHGFALAPRLTVYPEFVLDPERWLDPKLHFAVLDRSDAEGLGRDDPGAVWPEKISAADTVGDGAEFVLVGHRSTAWYSGADNPPPRLVPRPAARGSAGSAVHEVLDGVLLGQEPGVEELVTLFSARGPEVAAVAEVADELRRSAVGDAVTWVRNRNINYTNVCTFKCRFCGFSKGPLSLNLRGTPYLLTLDDIAERVREAADLGATEVCLQGGIHPDFDGDYYLDVTRAVKDAAPGHPRPRLHRPRGDRGRPPARRAARRRTSGG